MVYSYLPYAVTELFCLVLACAILFRLDNSIGSEHEVRELRLIVYAYLGMLASDIFWALNEDGIVVLDTLPNALLNAITIICISLGCYFWFKYMEDRLRRDIATRKYFNILTALPVIAVCVIDFTSIFTGFVFYIDDAGHFQNNYPWFDIPTTINYLYLLIPTIAAIVMAQKTKSRALRHEYLSYPLYMIVPLICGMSEDVMPNVPILALCIFMVILIFFLTLQNRQISTDALTGLNNRRWLNRYLDKKLDGASPEEPIALYMMDINDFKSINDNYGHIEGDNALKSLATALRLTAARYDAFVARYGGDEFCLVADIEHRDPDEIERNIVSTLRTAQSVIETGEKPYKLSVSIGYAVCDHPESKIEAFIGRADDVLYEHKQEWHRTKGRTH